MRELPPSRGDIDGLRRDRSAEEGLSDRLTHPEDAIQATYLTHSTYVTTDGVFFA